MTYEEIIQALREKVPQWISVEERRPEPPEEGDT